MRIVIVVADTYPSFSCMLKHKENYIIPQRVNEDETDGVPSALMSFESNKVRSSESSSFILVRKNLIGISATVRIDPHSSIGNLKCKFNIFLPSIF